MVLQKLNCKQLLTARQLVKLLLEERCDVLFRMCPLGHDFVRSLSVLVGGVLECLATQPSTTQSRLCLRVTIKRGGTQVTPDLLHRL